jgi:hypothetical protein
VQLNFMFSLPSLHQRALCSLPLNDRWFAFLLSTNQATQHPDGSLSMPTPAARW